MNLKKILKGLISMVERKSKGQPFNWNEVNSMSHLLELGCFPCTRIRYDFTKL